MSTAKRKMPTAAKAMSSVVCGVFATAKTTASPDPIRPISIPFTKLVSLILSDTSTLNQSGKPLIQHLIHHLSPRLVEGILNLLLL